MVVTSLSCGDGKQVVCPFKGALGNYFNLIKPFRNHFNGSITCSGENGDFPPSVPRQKNNNFALCFNGNST